MKDREKQLEIVERLQLKWLERMEALLDAGDLTATDAATLARFLSDNGWTLDPNKLPQHLRDKLSTPADTLDFADEDDAILPFKQRAG